jgi:hypothetical protein
MGIWYWALGRGGQVASCGFMGIVHGAERMGVDMEQSA